MAEVKAKAALAAAIFCRAPLSAHARGMHGATAMQSEIFNQPLN
jgi:hypothetical protein